MVKCYLGTHAKIKNPTTPHYAILATALVERGYIPVERGYLRVEQGYLRVEWGYLPVEHSYLPVE